MKFVSFKGPRGHGFGLETSNGVVDLGPRLKVQTLMALIEEGRLSEAGAYVNEKPDFQFDELVLLPPIPHPHHIFCIGTNYLDHLHEVQSAGVARPVPKHPPLFVRYPETLVGHNGPLVFPNASANFDYEAELAVIIGTGGHNIGEDKAVSHIAGYACFNDGSIRDWQFHSTQVTAEKTFSPQGHSVRGWSMLQAYRIHTTSILRSG